MLTIKPRRRLIIPGSTALVKLTADAMLIWTIESILLSSTFNVATNIQVDRSLRFMTQEVDFSLCSPFSL